MTSNSYSLLTYTYLYIYIYTCLFVCVYVTLILSDPNRSNNTLVVPGVLGSNKQGSSNSNAFLSPSHRGISYPPPSPTR